MCTSYKSYKFRIYPTEDQKTLFAKHFGCCRFVYNYFLFQHLKNFETDHKSFNYNECSAILTQLKKEFTFLNEVSSQCLPLTLKHLNSAFKNFYCFQSNYPQFKSKKEKNSYTVVQNISLKNDKLCIPKMQNGIKINLHRSFEGKIQHCTIVKTSSQKYFCCLLSKIEIQPKEKTGLSCGIDLGIKEIAVLNDGQIFNNKKNTRKYEEKLATAQIHLSHKIKGSHSFDKQKKKVSIIHEKITNSRNDHLQKISTQIINQYDLICTEDLNISGMVKNKNFSQALYDVSWYTFLFMLSYKAKWYGKKIIKIDRYYPSSQTCSICGAINVDLKLNERQWICSNGHVLDRDLNASKNILNEGLKLHRQELAITST